MSTINKAIILASEYHANQQYDGKPYVYHCLKVLEKLDELFFADTDTRIAAILHDIIEDTELKRVDLYNLGFSNKTLDIVDLVTKDKKLTYYDNITRIIVSGNIEAARIKYCDNLVNLDHGEDMPMKLKDRWAISSTRLKDQYNF